MGARTTDDLDALLGLDRRPLARQSAGRRWRKGERRRHQAPGKNRRRSDAEIVKSINQLAPEEGAEPQAPIKETRKASVAEMTREERRTEFDPKCSAMSEMVELAAMMADHLARIGRRQAEHRKRRAEQHRDYPWAHWQASPTTLKE
jgi:hypothetical protein